MISVVNKLKEARQEKGISVEKVSEDTKISIKFIEALEKEDYSLFPAEVYLKGFLNIYARYLSLDAKELLEDYKKSKGTV